MKVVGVTMDWSLRPTLAFEKPDGSGGWILPRSFLDLWYAEYFPDGPGSWPIDPASGERLPRVK